MKDVVQSEDLTFSREMKFGTYKNRAVKPSFVFIISKCFRPFDFRYAVLTFKNKISQTCIESVKNPTLC